MKRSRPQENTPRVIASAIAFFGGLAALGILEGTFARLGIETVLVLGAFAIAFALLTYGLDSGVRRSVNRLFAPRAAARKRPGGRAAAA
jgi:hypothetical protein